MQLAWERLIRFVGEDGQVYLGEPLLDDDSSVNQQAADGELRAKVLEGDLFDENAKLAKEIKVVKLLSPLTSTEVPIVRCVGLNYVEHGLSHLKTPPWRAGSFC